MYWHITLTSVGRLTLFLDDASLRRAVHALVRVLAGHLLLFCIVDDHVHVAVTGDRRRAGVLTSALSRSLASITPVRLAPAMIRAVDGRPHLESLVGYLLRQPSKHGLPVPAALYEGSCFADLVGARWLEAFDATAIARALPRLDLAAVAAREGLPSRLLALDDEGLRDVQVDVLVAATCAALALPDLDGNDPLAALGRIAVCVLAARAGLPAAGVPFSARTHRRLRDASLPREVEDAVRLRLALQAAAHAPA